MTDNLVEDKKAQFLNFSLQRRKNLPPNAAYAKMG
jgi:hypothetical protein